ncbi:MAG TPA: hypothetical protein DCY94_04165 [Firmicutes bacterium]|nr:hypothetical protein [Bacillota bacterium]
MSTRMDKYYIETEEETPKRTAKNRDYYREVSDEEIERVNLTNNVSVLDASLEDLDIDKLKVMLEEKYREKEKPTDTLEMDLEPKREDKEDTKEYDLKKVLETAHKNKKTDYDRDRFTKVHEQEYDILKSLNIEKKETPKEEDAMSVEDANLMNLIKTVNYNAEKFKKASEDKETSLLADLIGDENTEVFAPIAFGEEEPDHKLTVVEEIERTKQISKQEIDDAVDEWEANKKESEENSDLEDTGTGTSPLSKTEELSNSFYTGKFQINDRDMDFKDLEGAMNGGSLIIKILIIIVVLVVLAVGVFLLNKYLNLGLF